MPVYRRRTIRSSGSPAFVTNICSRDITSNAMVISMWPKQNDEGKVEMLVYGSVEHNKIENFDTPIATIRSIEDEDGDTTLMWKWHPEELARVIGLGTCAQGMMVSDLEEAIMASIEAFIPFEPFLSEDAANKKEVNRAEEWMEIAAALSIPRPMEGLSESDAAIQIENNFQSKELRWLANAIGIDEFKKSEIAKILSSDLLLPERVRKIHADSVNISPEKCDVGNNVHRIVVTEDDGTYLVEWVVGEDGKWTTKEFKLDYRGGHPDDAPFLENNFSSQTNLLSRSIVSDAENHANAIRQMAPSAADNIILLGRQFNTSTSLAQKAQKKYARDLQEHAEKLRDVNEHLKSVTTAINSNKTSAVKSKDGKTVKIMEREFPRFDSENAPNEVVNYSLSAWRAKVRFGRGGETVEYDASDFTDAMLHDRVTRLVGPPGVGKTSIVQQLCHVLGIESSVIQFHRDKPVEQLIGTDKIVDGKQVWVDGEITSALRLAARHSEPSIVMFDEFDHASAEIQSMCHPATEGRDFDPGNGEMISVGDNVRFVITANTSGHGDTSGRHAAAGVSDSAFNSRVCATFHVDYMRIEDEVGVLIQHGLDITDATELSKFALATRASVLATDSGESFDGMYEPVCLRHMIAYSKMRSRNVDKRKAFAATIISSLPARDRQVANELSLVHMNF